RESRGHQPWQARSALQPPASGQVQPKPSPSITLQGRCRAPPTSLSRPGTSARISASRRDSSRRFRRSRSGYPADPPSTSPTRSRESRPATGANIRPTLTPRQLLRRHRRTYDANGRLAKRAGRPFSALSAPEGIRAPNLLILSVRRRSPDVSATILFRNGLRLQPSIAVRSSPGRFAGVCIRKVETGGGPEPIGGIQLKLFSAVQFVPFGGGFADH